MKKLILLLFLVIYGCGERKPEDISKKNTKKDSIQKDSIQRDSVEKDTKEEKFIKEKIIDTNYVALSFDSLLTKFLYKNPKYFTTIPYETYPFMFTDRDKSYKLTYKDFRTFQLHSLYKKIGLDHVLKDYEVEYETPFPPVAISVNYLANDLIGITVLQRREVGFDSYFLIYRNKKLISYAEEPFMRFGGDIGTTFHCKTQKNNDSTFYTVDKVMRPDKLIWHSEILTIIDKNGIIKQNKRVFVDRNP